MTLTFDFEQTFEAGEANIADGYRIITESDMFLQTYEYTICPDRKITNLPLIRRRSLMLHQSDYDLFNLLFNRCNTMRDNEDFRSSTMYRFTETTLIKQNITATYMKIKTDDLTNRIMHAIEPILNKISILDMQKGLYKVIFSMNSNKAKCQFITSA